MRLLPALLALPLLAIQANAQSAPPPADRAAQPSPRHRMTWQERFTSANASHDGHLTLEQAKGGDPSVARHFHEIDADNKGYVTEDDIRAWHKLQRTMRHANHPAAAQGPRPQPAFQRGSTEPRQINTDGKTMLPMNQPPDTSSSPNAGGVAAAPRRPGT